MANILDNIEDKAKTKMDKGKDKIQQVARQYNLDPHDVQSWPEEIKKKLT